MTDDFQTGATRLTALCCSTQFTACVGTGDRDPDSAGQRADHDCEAQRPEIVIGVPDLEIVVPQAIKSRRWFGDPEFWQLVLRRLDPGARTRVRVLDGDEGILRELLGPVTTAIPWTLDDSRPVVQGEINIVQPGLSWGTFASRLASGNQSAIQIRDLLTAFDDAVSGYVSTSILCST